MKLPKFLGGNDRELAATKYAGRESASDRAARKEAEASARRRRSHHKSGADRAARKGQAWSAKQR